MADHASLHCERPTTPNMKLSQNRAPRTSANDGVPQTQDL